jgi:hypothetical protein
MITYPHQDDFLFYEGESFRVEWFYTIAGRMPGREHYFALDALDQERLLLVVKHIANAPIGTLFPKPLYRLEDGANKIYAFKPRGERYFNFTTAGRRIIITNAYSKHSQKMGKTDLDKLRTAVLYREDYLRRTQNGTYYENED